MIIGLTGGIAAGKSTVRDLLAKRPNLAVFDADASVRRLLSEDADVISRVRQSFGAEFIGADGKPDRVRLRELIYSDSAARRRLEEVLHPRVRSEWMTLRERCLAQGSDLLADIPLLYETGAQDFFHAVVVVGCAPETQISRLAARGIGRRMAEAMLASQWPVGQKIERADYVIWNDGSLAALGRQTGFFVTQIFPA